MPTKQVLYSKDGKGGGGLNKAGDSDIPDNDFSVLTNFRRDSSRRLITRRGHGLFGDDVDGKPITSYFFFQRDDGGGKIALRFSGTKLYKYTEATDVWTEIYSGLSEYMSGSSGPRTRWDCSVYKNLIIAGNGIDPCLTITIPGGVVTAYPAKPKCRLFEYMGDRIIGFKEILNPITLYYANAAAASVLNFDDNSLVVGGDEMGMGTGLKEAGQVVLAGKAHKIYAIDFANESALPLNAKQGMYSDRAWWSVGNGTIFFSNEGLNNLTPRSGVEGAQALEKDVDSIKVNPLLKDIVPSSYDSNCGYLMDNLEYDQYFFSFDASNDDIPDTTLVRATNTGDYSLYTTPPAYQYGIYIMDDGEVKHLIASSIGGQMYELETGFTDNGKSINYELQTKNWDLDNPGVWKDIERIDIFGVKNNGSRFTVEIFFDDELVASTVVGDETIDVGSGSVPIGYKPIGSVPLAKGVATTDLFSYKLHFSLLGYGGCDKIKVRIFAYGKNIIFSLDKIVINWNGNTFDLINNNNIA